MGRAYQPTTEERTTVYDYIGIGSRVPSQHTIIFGDIYIHYKMKCIEHGTEMCYPGGLQRLQTKLLGRQLCK